jgi:fluoride ion exporter CrcB/FEX
LNIALLFAVFAGGALGSVARYLVWLGIEEVGISLAVFDLVATAVVNIAGAGFLGFVHSRSINASEKGKAFWGSGFAGGFTTMSGLALITAGSSLGLSEIGYLYWFGVAGQFAVGILAYWLVRSSFEKTKGQVS